MKKLTYISTRGEASMVDVSAKAVMRRGGMPGVRVRGDTPLRGGLAEGPDQLLNISPVPPWHGNNFQIRLF